MKFRYNKYRNLKLNENDNDNENENHNENKKKTIQLYSRSVDFIDLFRSKYGINKWVCTYLLSERVCKKSYK